MPTSSDHVTRRDFLKASAAAAAVTPAVLGGAAYAAGSDTMRVGFIGCGGQGTRDIISCIKSTSGVQVTAMGDLFRDNLERSVAKLKNNVPDNLKVTDETCFVGFDAYKKVLASDVDMVVLATPPHFRPEHIRAAIEAGKHVFAEKPIAVDPVGIRSVIESGELAKSKGLALVAGTQRRHQNSYIEMLKRVHNGAIGDIVGGQVYWIDESMTDYWPYFEQKDMSDMEWQCRNWPWFDWLGGDHFVEQHVHNIDVMNWAMGGPPVRCLGMGGREVRDIGNIFDHFAVEYEFANGVKIQSLARQIDGCDGAIGERIVGTKGVMLGDGVIQGENAWEYNGPTPNPYVVEQADLIASIRAGEPLNEAQRVAESTLTAIMGRVSAYTGRRVSYNWAMNSSKLDMRPAEYAMGDLPTPPVAIPGKTRRV